MCKKSKAQNNHRGNTLCGWADKRVIIQANTRILVLGIPNKEFMFSMFFNQNVLIKAKFYR